MLFKWNIVYHEKHEKLQLMWGEVGGGDFKEFRSKHHILNFNFNYGFEKKKFIAS